MRARRFVVPFSPGFSRCSFLTVCVGQCCVMWSPLDKAGAISPYLLIARHKRENRAAACHTTSLTTPVVSISHYFSLHTFSQHAESNAPSRTRITGCAGSVREQAFARIRSSESKRPPRTRAIFVIASRESCGRCGQVAIGLVPTTERYRLSTSTSRCALQSILQSIIDVRYRLEVAP